MTTLLKRQYGDPLEVLIKAEEETCKGCKYREVASNGTKPYCGNPDRKSLDATKRCDDYEEIA